MASCFKEAVTAVLVGAGNRARIYASYAQQHPEELRIVGVVDPNPERRRIVQELYGFSDEYCFERLTELTARARIADAAINGTMDKDHVATTLPLLPLGYDVLLEKPAALSRSEILQLNAAAERYGNRIMICHVLRYAPFYYKIKELLLAGAVGEILHLTLEERVSASHVAVSYARGKWGNRERCGSGMLLAKSSHDVDLLLWLANAVPTTVQSIASGRLFDPGRKPLGAGSRCLKDCAVEADCLYSARAAYVEHPERWGQYVWDFKAETMTSEERERFIREESPYGRCVWDCDYKNISQQSLLLQFGDAMTASFNMLGGSAEGGRRIHVLGTEGEIEGRFEDDRFELRRINLSKESGYTTEIYRIDTGRGQHGGGDFLLVEDFVRYAAGFKPSIAVTSLAGSVAAHLTIFAAEEACATGRVINYGEYSANTCEESKFSAESAKHL